MKKLFTAAILLGLAEGTIAQTVPALDAASRPSTRPATQPSGEGRFGRLFGGLLGGGGPATGVFDSSFFKYEKKTPEVVWRTPTKEQIQIYLRPPQLSGDLKATDQQGLPEPVVFGGVALRWFAFKGVDGTWVPGLLATPPDAKGPLPLVVATHGLLGHKMQVVAQVAPSLTKRGFAVMAIDLPLHGERPGWGRDLLNPANPLAMMNNWRTAVINLRQEMDVGDSMPLIDHGKPITLLGYSLGSWMTTITGAADPRASLMVLMVGGATELSADLMRLPMVASADPRNAIAAFSPRPVLMVNGTRDQTVTPVMADRLFDAAKEPKERRWYEMGHLLKDPAFEDTADWIASHVPARTGKGSQ